MKTLDLADVARLPEELKDGEPIELREGGRVVARVVPQTSTIEETIEELIAEGNAHRGTGSLTEEFFTRPRPKFEGSVLEQLLADRRKNDW